MLKHLAARWLILGLAGALVAGSAALGQQKYRLHAPYSAGDMCTVDSTMDLKFVTTINVSGSGQGDQQYSSTVREREAYREKVLAVDPKGPSLIRRTYAVARTVTTDPYLNETTKVSSVQGRTVTIRRVGSQVTVSAEGGKLLPEDKKNMISELIRADGEYFPHHDLCPGDEWPIDPTVMFALFPGVQKADARYRFDQVVLHAGRPCAQIHVMMDVQGTAPGTRVPMTIKLSGSLYRDLDLKRTVAEDETGPVTIEGQQEQNGTSIHLSGHGTMHVRETHHWLQVDGKKVTAEG